MLDKILGVGGAAPSSEEVRWSRMIPVRSTSGIWVDEDTALTYSAVFSAVKVISETVSMLPWRPYRESGQLRELLVGTRLDELLHRKPNEEQTAFLLREYLVTCALLHGNGYCEIERTVTGEPVALHPIHPERVEPMRGRDRQLFYRVRDEYGSHDDLPTRSIFHLRGPTKDGIVGRSVLSLARESFGLGIGAERFASAFLGNGAMPSLFIEQGKDAPEFSKEGVENMLESFERRHKGVTKAGKAAYLERGLTVKAVGIPQKDAQFLETRKFGVTDVARWFRVPPHKIADMEKATFSNIEEQERNFVNDAIMPWAVRLEQEANFKLVSEKGVVTKLEVRALLRGTNKDRAEFYTKMRDLGALSINDILALEDMNPIDGGDLRLVPANMISLQRAAQSGGTDTASAVRGVLREAHERMMSKEAKAVERAVGSGKDFTPWAKEFYARHEEQLRDALMPGAVTVGALRGLDLETVAGVVAAHARLLCESSVTEATQAGAITVDAKRVAAYTERLIGCLIGAANA